MLELARLILKDRKVKEVIAWIREILDEIEEKYGEMELKEILEGGE